MKVNLNEQPARGAEPALRNCGRLLPDAWSPTPPSALGEDEGVISVSVSQESDPRTRLPRHPIFLRRLRAVGGQRYRLRHDGRDSIQDLRSVFHQQVRRARPGAGSRAGVIRSHGGTVNVVSAPGQGSRFEILLPCSGEAGEGDWRAAAVPAAGGGAAGFCAGARFWWLRTKTRCRLAVSRCFARMDLPYSRAPDGETGDRSVDGPARARSTWPCWISTLPGMSSHCEGLEGFCGGFIPARKVIVTTALQPGLGPDATIGGQHPWLYLRKPHQLSQLQPACCKASVWTNGE